MARRYRYRRGGQKTFDTDIMHVLNLTPMMDILTVLVIFLLVTAVFMSITIMELSIPTGAGAAAAGRPNFNIEVIVRKTGLQISNGSAVQAAIPKKDGAYDIEQLSRMLVRLKEQYPEKQDATVLMEQSIEYDHLIQVMDAVRVADVRAEGSGEMKKIVLFPNISIGDAP
ncbi:MAG: biopolymer transporter ExbD [Nitrospirae bacterium GWD2_57_9]|nr:MAG: biopolymer transporter ExbD [Nitrospirae bacterium GWD2_57_9]OGW46044.1 MAG: biopolymer transporter ExbD [Nitrospirae bacterium GWC2_57_9]